MFRRALIVSFMLGVAAARAWADPRPRPDVAELLEDDADGLLQKLAQQDGGPSVPEAKDVYSGKAAIKIVPMQRYARNIAGWNYRIPEKPKAGEYRYLRFAWKADGARGIMLQLHDEKDWNLRLTAGIDAQNWGTKFVAPAPPAEWTVVTRDLFQEFGERSIRGMALTVFDGRAGYFDHIYLGRTIDDLDRIDVTGLSEGPPPQLKPDELARLWRDLAGADAPKAYRAFWALVASPDQSVPYLHRTLTWSRTPEAARQIRTWIDALDADDFKAREQAALSLAEHLEEATVQLKKGLTDDSLGPEARLRIEQLLRLPNGAGGGARRTMEAVRILAYVHTDAAMACLRELSAMEDDPPLSAAARAALRPADATK